MFAIRERRTQRIKYYQIYEYQTIHTVLQRPRSAGYME